MKKILSQFELSYFFMGGGATLEVGEGRVFTLLYNGLLSQSRHVYSVESKNLCMGRSETPQSEGEGSARYSKPVLFQ